MKANLKNKNQIMLKLKHRNRQYNKKSLKVCHRKMKIYLKMNSIIIIMKKKKSNLRMSIKRQNMIMNKKMRLKMKPNKKLKKRR